MRQTKTGLECVVFADEADQRIEVWRFGLGWIVLETQKSVEGESDIALFPAGSRSFKKMWPANLPNGRWTGTALGHVHCLCLRRDGLGAR